MRTPLWINSISISVQQQDTEILGVASPLYLSWSFPLLSWHLNCLHIISLFYRWLRRLRKWTKVTKCWKRWAKGQNQLLSVTRSTLLSNQVQLRAGRGPHKEGSNEGMSGAKVAGVLCIISWVTVLQHDRLTIILRSMHLIKQTSSWSCKWDKYAWNKHTYLKQLCLRQTQMPEANMPEANTNAWSKYAWSKHKCLK